MRTLNIIIVLLILAACSREPAPPAAKASAAKPPVAAGADKPLVDIIHEAIRFYAEGGKEFSAPPGVVVTKGITSKKGVETAVIAGIEQRGPSIASITASIPASWLTTERQKLDGLKVEIGELTGCAASLSGGSAGDKLCRVEEITANSMPGIAIRAEKAPHLTMTMISAR